MRKRQDFFDEPEPEKEVIWWRVVVLNRDPHASSKEDTVRASSADQAALQVARRCNADTYQVENTSVRRMEDARIFDCSPQARDVTEEVWAAYNK